MESPDFAQVETLPNLPPKRTGNVMLAERNSLSVVWHEVSSRSKTVQNFRTHCVAAEHVG